MGPFGRGSHRGWRYRLTAVVASVLLALTSAVAGIMALGAVGGAGSVGSGVAGADTPAYQLVCSVEGGGFLDFAVMTVTTNGYMSSPVRPNTQPPLQNLGMRLQIEEAGPFSDAAGQSFSGTGAMTINATDATPASQTATFTIPSMTIPNPIPEYGFVAMATGTVPTAYTTGSSSGTFALTTSTTMTFAMDINGTTSNLNCQTNPPNETETIVSVSVAPGPPNGTFYVAQGGTNTDNNCWTATSPCATISYAQSQAADGETIDVSGTITDNVQLYKQLTITGAGASSPAVVQGSPTDDLSPVIWVVSGLPDTLDNLTITGGNIDSDGSGVDISSDYSAVTMNNDTVTGNTTRSATGLGSGVMVSRTTTATITNSTISGNSASGGGAGIYSGGTLSLIDSTVSGNTSSGDYSGVSITGGGAGISVDGQTTLIGDTISGNTSPPGLSGGLSTSGGMSPGAVTVGATIIANNPGGNCGQSNPQTITSLGYNLTNGPTGLQCTFTQPTDVIGADPQLGQLADNGGPTQTMLPASTSPAVAQIPLNTTLGSTQVCPGTDQRGVARPQPADGTACTIGSVEVAPGVAPAITSANATTFTVGTAGSFQATATGQPDPTFSEQGALPSGVSFSSSGLLSGTPASGTQGTYPITITATNGISPDATQPFTLTVTSSTPPPPVTKNTLEPGQSLTANQSLTVPSGKYRLVMQSDGNLVEYQGSKALWSSGTQGHPGAGVVMQKDGNLVIYSKGKAIWSSKTSGHPGAYLTLQASDGNVVIYTPAHKALWSTGT